ncbi:hypothetical protein [Pseudonocardia sp. TRM90224]|uniref:hypothetical protein n=1 Tax=Pseudonocardia sp. TRM90224 TaxID=2812678 RepID=UPI001E5F4013|nr:hypothetical protein [Pseudonocardia sp. TRM90224]
MSHPADPYADLAERVAAVVTAHPAVAALHGGEFGAVATYLPGRKLVGVRIGDGDEPVEVGLVVHAGHPIPQVVRSVRRDVSALCPGSVVDIVVADIVLADAVDMS